MWTEIAIEHGLSEHSLESNTWRVSSLRGPLFCLRVSFSAAAYLRGTIKIKQAGFTETYDSEGLAFVISFEISRREKSFHASYALTKRSHQVDRQKHLETY